MQITNVNLHFGIIRILSLGMQRDLHEFGSYFRPSFNCWQVREAWIPFQDAVQKMIVKLSGLYILSQLTSTLKNQIVHRFSVECSGHLKRKVNWTLLKK